MKILDKILSEHQIDEPFENAKKMDKENRIFMNENRVVKIYYPKKFPYYYNELEVYKGLGNKDYLPTLQHSGENEDYKYIIISKLQGHSLFDSWDNYTEEQHNNFIIQIATILRDINNIKVEKKNFKQEFENNFKSVLASLDYSEKFNKLINYLYENNIDYLRDEELCKLIHVDVHFYNFFVDEEKVYAYDFENTMMAPVDYQLLRWYRMWQYPQSFFYPKDSLSSEQIDSYKMIMPELLNNYNELAECPNITERVKLYSLMYLLQESKRCNLGEDLTKQYIKENKSVYLGG